MSRKARIHPGFLVLLLATTLMAGGGIAYFSPAWPSSLRGRDPTPSSRSPSPSAGGSAAVGAIGRIQPASEVIDVAPPSPPGDRVARLMVAELDLVRSGDPLAELESRDERLAERNAAANRLAEAKAQCEAETELGEAQIREAEINTIQIDKVQAESIEAQKAQLKVDETNLQTAKIDLARIERLRARNAVTQEDLDHQVLIEARRKHEVAVEQANLTRLTLDRDISLTLSRAQLQRVRAAVKRAQALIPVRSLEQDLASAEARLRRTIVRAPIDGQVLKILTWPGEATGGKPILRLGDTRLMEVVAEVYETDIGRVRLGQKASITSPALPRVLTGVVNRVGALIYKEDVLHVDPTADADARLVEVRIRLADAAPTAGLTNLQVDVRIGGATEAGR